MTQNDWYKPGDPEDMTPPVIDTSVAHPARIYDYWLGGCFLYTHARERVRYPSKAVAMNVRAARVRGGDFRADS